MPQVFEHCHHGKTWVTAAITRCEAGDQSEAVPAASAYAKDPVAETDILAQFV